jgi:hypothetical protein
MAYTTTQNTSSGISSATAVSTNTIAMTTATNAIAVATARLPYKTIRAPGEVKSMAQERLDAATTLRECS